MQQRETELLKKYIQDDIEALLQGSLPDLPPVVVPSKESEFQSLGLGVLKTSPFDTPT